MTSKNIPDDEQLLSSGRIAQMFDVNTETVGTWFREGILNGRKINGRWRATRSEVKRFGRERYNITEEEGTTPNG